VTLLCHRCRAVVAAVLHRCARSDKAVQLLGWAPKHDLIKDLKWYLDG
jgi:hypothetical protein